MKIRNKVTGEIVEIPDAPGARPIGPSDPKVPLQVRGAELGNQRTQQQMDQDAALLPYRKRVMSAQAQKAEREAARAAKGPPPTAGEITRRNELRDKLSAMKNLEANLNAMEEQYQRTFRIAPRIARELDAVRADPYVQRIRSAGKACARFHCNT